MSVLPLSVLKKSLQVYKEMNRGLNFKDVNVDLKLAVFLHPIHTTWLVEMCNFYPSLLYGCDSTRALIG